MPTLDALHDAILEAASVNAGATLIDLRVGPYWSVVQASTGAGMASTLRSEMHLHGSQPIPDAGSLLEKSPIELAVGLHSSVARRKRPSGWRQPTRCLVRPTAA